MTSLSGEFQTDLGIDDAMVACTEAIDGLGWRIDTVDAQRVIAYTDSGEPPPRIEVNLNETGGGTEFRIIGSDNEQNQLEQDDLIAVLDKARDAINRSMEDAERPQEQTSSSAEGKTEERQQAQATGGGGSATPAGWYPDVHDESRQRYWDGKQWTDDFRPADGGGSKSEPSSQSESKPGKKSRKEAREEKRNQSRERAEQRRQERLGKRKERAQQSGASTGQAAAAGAAAGGAAATATTQRAATAGNDSAADKGDGSDRGERAPQGGSESTTPSQFRSLHLIATLYHYLGYLVVVGGVISAIAAVAGADDTGEGAVAAIGVLIGTAFAALFVFGTAAAIRLALGIERNTRDTAELLRRERGD